MMHLSIYFIKDTGHNHHAQFYTSWAGEHSHDYKDIWLSEHAGVSSDWVQVNPTGVSGSDRDNVCHQITRTSFNAGGHNHLVDGDTWNSHAQLTGTGNNQHFDNRQYFTVVQFIIYIQN